MKRSSFTGLRYAVSGGLWGLNFHLPPCWWSQQARTHSRKRPPEKSLLSLRENIRLRRRCIPRSYFLVHCSFPISKVPSYQARTHKRNRPPEKHFLSLRENFRLRRRCWSYFLVHCFFSAFNFFSAERSSRSRKNFRFQIFPGLA